MPKFRRARALSAGIGLAMVVALFSGDYTVAPGDTLGEIARDHDVPLSDLVAANDISNPNLIYPGQVLLIPGDDTATEITHVVVRGETLGHISAVYGVSIMVLVEANKIRDPDLIRVGQKIVVPGSAKAGGGGSGDRESSSSDPTIRSGRFHIVQAGEDLEKIAAQYSGVTPQQIARANGIIDGRIYRGTRLFLDGPPFTATGTAGEISYTIQRGDRLSDIAAAHDIATSTLIELNDISNPDLIISGDTLVIPTGETWVCPIEGATFFNDWGFPRGGGTRYHEGNDLFTDHGAQVYAPVSGVVEFKEGTIAGKQFNLRGDDGVEYLGSHLSAFGKSGRVKAGDVVGFVGTSGNARGTPPHLHFGIYLDGEIPVNPYPTLLAHGCK